MGGAQQHDGQVHAEVEHLEDLRLRQGQDQDASELGQRDATEHLRTVVDLSGTEEDCAFHKIIQVRIRIKRVRIDF